MDPTRPPSLRSGGRSPPAQVGWVVCYSVSQLTHFAGACRTLCTDRRGGHSRAVRSPVEPALGRASLVPAGTFFRGCGDWTWFRTREHGAVRSEAARRCDDRPRWALGPAAIVQIRPACLHV